MSKTYTRTATEHETGRPVTRVHEVITSPGRVAVRKYRNGQSQPGYAEDVRTRFPALTAWRVGMTLRRDGYRRTA